MTIIQDFWSCFKEKHPCVTITTKTKLQINDCLLALTPFFDKRLRVTLRGEESEIRNLIRNMESMQDELVRLRHLEIILNKKILELEQSCEDLKYAKDITALHLK